MCLRCLNDFNNSKPGSASQQPQSVTHDKSNQQTTPYASQTCYCSICGHNNGYLVLTTKGTFIHKRCGFLIRGAIYHLQSSLLSKHLNNKELYIRTFAQFVISPLPWLGMTTNHICKSCGRQTGLTVCCSVIGCNTVIMIRLKLIVALSFRLFGSHKCFLLL